MTTKYRVTANMLGGVVRGARVNLVLSLGDDPYTTEDRTVAERRAAEVRALPEAYRDVLIEQDRDNVK